MISADELQRGLTLTPEQILKQLDAMRTMLLESQGGGHQAYERIRAADPLRRTLSETVFQTTPKAS
jgi:hypothetical protein